MSTTEGSARRPSEQTYLLVSDLHANSLALDAVLSDARGRAEIGCLLCAGDLLGYGWDPNGVIERLREHRAVIVEGNHDWAVSSGEDFHMEQAAVVSIALNLEALTEDNFEYLQGLTNRPKVLHEGEIALVHGSFESGGTPRHERYVLDEEAARAAASALVHPEAADEDFGEVRVGIVGHTHVQTWWSGWFGPDPEDSPEDTRFWRYGDRSGHPRSVVLRLARGPRRALRSAALVNPGSVGQPRDGDPRAAYCLLRMRPDHVEAEFRRVAYDVEKARRRLRAHGYPEELSERLRNGGGRPGINGEDRPASS